MPTIQLQLLGAFQVANASGALHGLESERIRALLAYLAVERSQPHRRSDLACLLWPDQQTDAALANLRQALNRARRGLASNGRTYDVFEVTRHTVAIAKDAPLRVDVETFCANIEATQNHSHRRLSSCLPCMALLGDAVALYRGPFCADLGLTGLDCLEEWRLVWGERLQAMMLSALATLTSHYQQRGDYAQAEELARQQLAIEELRENAHCQMMRALALSGRRTEALAQYERCRRLLKRELDIPPSEATTALYEHIRIGEDEALVPASLVHNLPTPPTPFVGRECELTTLGERLASPDQRLITLVGPSGAGKTRLALKGARRQLGAFRDGICYVSLERLLPGEHMLYALINAVGLPYRLESAPRAQLERYLASREMLLVIDQMERAQDQVGLLAKLLSRAPRLQLLVASCVPLGLPGESTLMVRGLAFRSRSSETKLTESDAARLFVDAAHFGGHDFAWKAGDEEALGQLLTMVDGLPLAIELAAQWSAIFALDEIVAQYREDIEFLGTPATARPTRQRSISQSLDYVWGSLSEPARRTALMLAQVGPATATQLAQEQHLAADELAALVDHPWIACNQEGGLDLLEIVRPYLCERRSSTDTSPAHAEPRD